MTNYMHFALGILSGTAAALGTVNEHWANVASIAIIAFVGVASSAIGSYNLGAANATPKVVPHESELDKLRNEP